MTNVPSDEDFERAKRLDREDSRGLEQVSENVTRRFKDRCPLHAFCILSQRDVDFRAYVFLEKDKDIETCRKSRVLEDLTSFVFEELERAGRGSRAEINVACEFDSHENVEANFDGDYLFRLH